VTLAPWDYLFESFSNDNFPDIFHPTWIAALVLLVVLTILYNVRTRALHRHAVYLEMWEWVWWTGLITFSLIIIEALFVFDFFLVLATMVIGLGTLVWIRFVRFPPFFAAYETRLAKERYFTKQKYADPEATIKKRPAAGRQQRQRRRRR
jgi:ABC-type xylose transport system permease subunit